MELSVIELRILDRIIELHKNDYSPNKLYLIQQMANFHRSKKTEKELLSMIDKEILIEDNDKISLNKEYEDFSWLEYLTSKNKSVIVLGMPGNHTIPFIEDLDKKDVMYIDHDVAWKSLMKSAKQEINIISPFADEKGFDLFGPTLINAIKKKIKVEIITRDLDIFSPDFYKKKAFSKFIKKLVDEVSNPNLNLYSFHDGTSDLEVGRHLGSVHAKMLIVDINAAYVGSGEFRGNSISKNVEIGYIIFDNLQQLREIFKSVKRISSSLEWEKLI